MKPPKVNWVLYYREFSRTHGGSPVLYRVDDETGKGGFLLFRDGWMYSRSSISGPEHPPVNNEDRARKALAYWTTRKRVISEELFELKEWTKALARHQDSRSAPLMTVERSMDEDDEGRRTIVNRPSRIDFDLLLAKIKELDDVVSECDREISSIPSTRSYDDNASHVELKVLTELQLMEIDKRGR